jgi:hypothetical protein
VVSVKDPYGFDITFKYTEAKEHSSGPGPDVHVTLPLRVLQC